MKCYYCGKEADRFELIQGKKACLDCVISAEKSMGHSREDIYGHEVDVNCLYCGENMEQVFLILHGTLIGILFAGLISWLNCYFQPMRSNDEVKILGCTEKKAALHCISCGAVLVRGNT